MSTQGASKSGKRKVDLRDQERYKVFYIAFGQEYAVPPRGHRVEKLACWVFSFSSSKMDRLFRSLGKPIAMPRWSKSVPKGHAKTVDVRVKVTQKNSGRTIYINYDSAVFTADEMRVYPAAKEVVDDALVALKKAAWKKRPRHDMCGDPDPPTRCHPHDVACWKREKPPNWEAYAGTERHWIRTALSKTTARHLRDHACTKLAQFKSEEAIGTLIRLLDVEGLANCAARGLARQGTPRAIKALTSRLRMGEDRTLSDHARINVEAIWALGHYRRKAALPYLLRVNKGFIPRGPEEEKLKRLLKKTIVELQRQDPAPPRPMDSDPG
jgi:hypothetical protein